MRITVPLSIMLLTMASAALAEPSRDDPAHSAASNQPDKVVCITQEVTGSRLGSIKMCKTNAEWAVYRREMRQIADRYQSGKNWQSLPGH